MVIELVTVARVYGGGLFFAGTDAATVLDAWRQWAPGLPDEITTSVALLRLPPDPQLPPPLQGQFVVHVRYCHLGAAPEAAAALAPIRHAGAILFDTIGEMPYSAVDSIHIDPTSPMPCPDRGIALTDFPAAAASATLAAHTAGTSLALIEIRLLGGALAQPVGVPNAVAGRTSAYSVYVLGVPAGPQASAVPTHVDDTIDALTPWRDTGLLNFTGHAKPGELQRVWSDADRGRLRDIARRYDPAGIFTAGAAFG